MKGRILWNSDYVNSFLPKAIKRSDGEYEVVTSVISSGEGEEEEFSLAADPLESGEWLIEPMAVGFEEGTDSLVAFDPFAGAIVFKYTWDEGEILIV